MDLGEHVEHLHGVFERLRRLPQPLGDRRHRGRELVIVGTASRATYMLGENYIVTKPVQTVMEMVWQGVFGEVYYAEGEYPHELEGLGERAVWHRHWQNGVDGVTHGMHGLRPILQWLAGLRVERVCCTGSASCMAAIGRRSALCG